MAVDRYRLAEVTDEMWESVPVNRISANAVLSSVVVSTKIVSRDNPDHLRSGPSCLDATISRS